MSSDIVAVGIDLGTTNSCVGVILNGKVELIANDQGSRLTPSVVAFSEGEVLVGQGAKESAVFNEVNVIYDAKRIMGRKYRDPEAQKRMENWPFTVIEDPATGKPNYEVNYRNAKKLVAPEEISSLVLAHMKKIAQNFIGKTVTHAVITVPAYFNNAQRQATIDAATIAGLKVLELINEPTAAAIAYGYAKNLQESKNILIFDLGGGTFDVVILTIEEGNYVAKAVSGDTYLGGSDFDDQLVNFLREDFWKKNKLDLTESTKAMAKLRENAEKAKINLSVNVKEKIHIECLFQNLDYELSISRAKFEDLCSDLFQNTLKPVETVLNDAKMGKDQIDDVILIGGSTRIPKIEELLQEFFERKTLNKTINPDEAVAYGAAVHAAHLSGETSLKDYNFSDITPLSLGINVRGKEMSTIIPRNTKIPTKKSQNFTTHSDNQSSVSIEVLEGESKLSRDNHLLGEFILDKIPPDLKGVPVIHVNFEIDKNGIFSVTAFDSLGKTEKNVTMKGNSRGMSKEEIEEKKVQHSKYLNEAEMELQMNELISNLEGQCDRTKKLIQSKKKKLSQKDVYEEIDSAFQKIQNWLNDDVKNASLQDCQEKKKELTELREKIKREAN